MHAVMHAHSDACAVVIHTCTELCMHAHYNACTHLRTAACTPLHVYTHTHTHTHARTHTLTHTDSHTHAHTHTHTRMCAQVYSIGPACDLTYGVTDLGNSGAVLTEIASGAHVFSKILAAAERPMVLVGVFVWKQLQR